MHFGLSRSLPNDIFVTEKDSKRTQEAPRLSGGVGAS
jgi:hypothetical protein